VISLKIETEVLVIGGGYSGILLSNVLLDRGFDVLIADSSMESEMDVFSRLKVVKSYYDRFIEEYRETRAQLETRILKATITRTVRIGCEGQRENEGGNERAERWDVEGVHLGVNYKITAERVFTCTGCYDKRFFPCGIFGSRAAGIFSIQNALSLISRGYRIGRNVLLLGMSKVQERIFEIVEEMLGEFDYGCEFVVGNVAEVLGRERVEAVIVDGMKFPCDTLIYFCGREEFNPFKLGGCKVGNINARTYDYEKVRKDVLKLDLRHATLDSQ